jgi:hypothetical protein
MQAFRLPVAAALVFVLLGDELPPEAVELLGLPQPARSRDAAPTAAAILKA